MQSEVIPNETPLLLDKKITEWLAQGPSVALEELTRLIGIRSEAGPIYRLIMVSPQEYPRAYAFLADKLRLIDELEDISSKLNGCDAVFKMRPTRQPLIESK
ncbi:MAG: hypothetical protein JWN73_2672 [Betaproteobacteria bacterium]|nr:hypothetical protein [Betaproteobacteria bacterium]